jgi:ribonuclease D
VAEGLKKQDMIGVDLENNHLKSYNGFLCLIQISTIQNENYLIDAIKLRNLIRKYLGDIFESENIVKVFHGCLHSDISWL